MVPPEKDPSGLVPPPLPPPLDPSTPRPSVWPVFVTFLLVFAAILVLQFGIGIILAGIYLARGTPPGDVQQVILKSLSGPMAFILLGLPTQLALGVAAWWGCRKEKPLAERLGLVPTPWPMWVNLLVIGGSIVPLALGIASAVGLSQLVKNPQNVAALYQQMTPELAIPFILFVALAPGFMEEIFFRGYLQRRLLQAWTPGRAVAVSTLLFTFLHITPAAMAGALFLGLYFGILAWRSGSIWPGIWCHVFVNGAWNVRNIFYPETPLPVLLGLVCVSFVCLLAVIPWLRRPLPTVARPSSPDVIAV